MALVPEPPQPKGLETPSQKGAEVKPISEKPPIESNEQEMIQRIDQDGDPDQVLQDIAETKEINIFNRDEILGEISDILQTEDENERVARTSEFTSRRLVLLTENSTPGNFTIMSGARKGFLHPESGISRNIMVDPFMVDDPEIYKLLIEKFKEFKDNPNWKDKSLREIAPYAILDTVRSYFGNGYATESTEDQNQTFYMDRSSATSEAIPLNELKGQQIAVCAEKAATAQNLLSFLGYESELVASTKCRLESPENDDLSGHMYNVVTSGENHLIFDPANPNLVTRDDGGVQFVLPSFYPIDQEGYTKLMSGGQVEITHRDGRWDGEKILPGKEYQRIYGGPNKV